MRQEGLQAKEIEKLLDIPKHRYEYLKSKIGIEPEVDQVEGQGRVHRYSYINALQFAYIHHANQLGLSPKACREMIGLLDWVHKENRFQVYWPPLQRTDDNLPWYQRERLFFYFLTQGSEQYFGLSSQDVQGYKIEVYRRGTGYNRDLVDSYQGVPSGDIWSDGSDSSYYAKFLGKINSWLDKAEAHMSINLTAIKRNIQEKLE